MTKTRHQIISDMCYTMRHDYGLNSEFDDYGIAGRHPSGMTTTERQALYRQKSQLYDHHIQPIVDELQRSVEENS